MNVTAYHIIITVFDGQIRGNAAKVEKRTCDLQKAKSSTFCEPGPNHWATGANRTTKPSKSWVNCN
jgi:hypothetical protein